MSPYHANWKTQNKLQLVDAGVDDQGKYWCEVVLGGVVHNSPPVVVILKGNNSPAIAYSIYFIHKTGNGACLESSKSSSFSCNFAIFTMLVIENSPCAGFYHSSHMGAQILVSLSSQLGIMA